MGSEQTGMGAMHIYQSVLTSTGDVVSIITSSRYKAESNSAEGAGRNNHSIFSQRDCDNKSAKHPIITNYIYCILVNICVQ